MTAIHRHELKTGGPCCRQQSASGPAVYSEEQPTENGRGGCDGSGFSLRKSIVFFILVMHQVLKVSQGNVSPFALINDTEHKAQLVIDKALMSQPAIHLHPLSNAATTSISPTDLMSFLKDIQAKTPIILDFDAVPAGEKKNRAPFVFSAPLTKRREQPVCLPLLRPRLLAEREEQVFLLKNCCDLMAAAAAASDKKHETKLGIAFDKIKEFSDWYPQVWLHSFLGKKCIRICLFRF